MTHLEHCIWFIQTYCPHWPTPFKDWQNLDGTFSEHREEAEACFKFLEEQGYIEYAPRPPRKKPWRSGKPNFLIRIPIVVTEEPLEIVANEFSLTMRNAVPTPDPVQFARYIAGKIQQLRKQRDQFKHSYTEVRDILARKL